MHIVLGVCLISPFFLCFVQTAVVEDEGGYKFAESSNNGISFDLRQGGPQKLLGK